MVDGNMKSVSTKRGATWIALLVCVFVPFAAAQAQSPQLQRPVAIPGQPWGVVLFEVPVPPDTLSTDLRVLVHESSGRLFYPATVVREVEVMQAAPPPPPSTRFRPGGLVDRLRSAVASGPQRRRVPFAVTVVALFQGDEPLNIQVSGDVEQRLSVGPARELPAAAHRELLGAWWKIYVDAARRAEATGDHPLLAHKYLVAMLSERLGLPIPPPADAERTSAAQGGSLTSYAEPLGSLALLSGIEPLRDEIFEQTLRGATAATAATVALPSAPQWRPQVLPPAPADVVVEKMAYRVPPECFYLRFGSFANYLWFQELSARHGGDLAQMVLVRGFNYETTARMERMLNTRMTALSKMFGDRLISDMAIVGRDLYMKEGASLGVLFVANNRSLLMSNFDSERRQTARSVPGAVLQTVQISGRDVSLLSTPDNRIRSFLVGDGDYVFLTTSRHLVERFFDMADDSRSLAKLESFRWARAWMPDANQYSVFAYFSPEFFHGLVSPQYQIELRRRLEAIAHLELAEVASRTASAEGLTFDDASGLLAARLLPGSFDRRADGARVLRSGNQWVDSLRGARGSFLPIVDVEVGDVSQEEAQRYARLASFYERSWQQMDPMLFGLRRFQATEPQVASGAGSANAATNPTAANATAAQAANSQAGDTGTPSTGEIVADRQAATPTERVTIEAYAAPFEAGKYGWVGDLLAPASPVAIRLPEDDIISGQARMNGAAPLLAPRAPYHLFGGVKDLVPPAPGDTKGLIQTLRALRAVPGYIGAWPGPGYLDRLPLGLGGGLPDPAGFSRSLIGLWRWQGGGFSLLSFDRAILENTAAQVAPVSAGDAAQVRVQVSNLAESKLANWVNEQWYQRSWRASQGDTRLLDTMQQQFKIPGPDALTAAETLLDVRLICPLGGKFEFVEQPAVPGSGLWISTAWAGTVVKPDGSVAPPPAYIAPWLQWFRGGRVHLTQFTDRLAMVGVFEIQKLPRLVAEPDALGPLNFDLFQLPFKLFGGGDAAPPAETPRTQRF
jgi:hypothetical protein